MGQASSKNGQSQDKLQKSTRKKSLFRRNTFQKHHSMNFYDEYLVQTPPLAKGEGGELRIGKKKNLDELRIIKVVYDHEDTKEAEQLKQELQILSELDHINIMKLYESCHDSTNGLTFIVFEYFIGKPLLDFLREEGGGMAESLVKKISVQLLSFLSYIHSKDIVYRDLKLENILFDGENIKIMDFSLARKLRMGKKLKVGVGVPTYVSPEMIKGRYDKRTDIWSLGVCIYTMLKKNYPFFGSSPFEVYNQIKKFDIEFQSDQTLSFQAKDLLERIFQKRPEKRISLSDLDQHVFFKINNKVRQSKVNQIKTFAHQSYLNMKNIDFSNPARTSIYINMCRNIQGPNHNKLQQLFNLIDVKKNGRISFEEFHNFYVEQEICNDEDELKEVFSKIDVEQTDEMTFQEFVISAQDPRDMLSEDNIKKFFKYLSDGREDIEVSELKKMFKDLELQDYEKFFDQIDTNKDERIDFKEFKKVLNDIINN